MSPAEVLAGTFPETECRESRAEFMLTIARGNYRLRMTGEDVHDSNLHIAGEAIRS